MPASLQKETLQKIHQGHQGIQRCRQRANTSVWWPGLSDQIKDLVQQCHQCARENTPHKEPLLPTALPNYPWQKVASDLFLLYGKTYLLVVDYFSRFPEVIKLTSTTAQSIIVALKSLFARYGIPQEVISDNGPQYPSQEFADFAKQYVFKHTTSSPHFPQSNGQAERGVKTVKKLLKGVDDPCMALLSYRSTPFPWCGLSPAQLLMGRQIRSNIPQLTETLTPQWPFLKQFRDDNKKFKMKQKECFDNCHGTRPLPDIPNDTAVWITTDGSGSPGKVTTQAETPRSYIVETPTGIYRRNRLHLTAIPQQQSLEQSVSMTTDSTLKRSPIQTRSRTGVNIVPPTCL